MNKEPKTLIEAIRYFSNADNCRDYLVARRWPDGVECPRCGSKSVTEQPKYNRWQCSSHHADIDDKRRQFTLKTGTIFEDSPIGLDKWLAAMWLIVNAKNGISSYELHRSLGVTQKSAWFMNHRIRLALGFESDEKLSGHIEVDETFIGGAARNMHKGKRSKYWGTGHDGKVAVMGLLERHTREVRAMVVDGTKRHHLMPNIHDHVEQGSEVFTDAHNSYSGLDSTYIHNVINHAGAYVQGNVHTNGIENFWALLKRALKGTYIAVEPFHLFRYLDEQAFRFNKRKLTDGDRLSLVVEQILGRRITYAELTGKTRERREPVLC